MQKARRFTCSTVCQSSPSNTSIRTRKKSRTSSVGGDSVKVRKRPGGASGDKSKPRPTKHNLSLLSSSGKPKRKAPKSCRAAKPNAGSLQSAVVLAPFYTLKKCFQNKLVDLYSQEKMKKVNQKSQMAKKKNMSFEYDIMELKPLDPTIKKEGKQAKKSRPKSRSASYCQCNRMPSKNERGAAENNPQQKRKASSREMFSPRTSSFSDQIRAKRRKLDSGTITPASLKNELPRGHDFFAPHDQFVLNDPNQSSSMMSSRSKCESWETYSNSPSCKEERVHGSLAISTTSFDSYLEHFDKGSWECSESNRKCNSRTKDRADQPPTETDFLPKSTAKSLIVNAERRNSDGEIVDFMDREPQTQVIPSVGSSQQWQPLRRQSRTKRKKPENDSAAVAATGYYLRSSSKEKEGNRTYLPSNRQECISSCSSMHNRTKTVQVEVGTQVEETNQEVQFHPVEVCHRQLRQQTPEEPPCEFKLRPSHQKVQTPPGEAAGDLEPPAEPQQIHSAEQQHQQQAEYFEGQREDAGLGLLAEGVDLMGAFPERFQGPADSRQPQDKEYIFGPRNSTSGLGESCEFSFGLKWVLSDDED